jgi:hypothetical protein
LHEGLDDAQGVDTAVDDLGDLFHGAGFDGLIGGQVRFKQYLEAALQVQALFDIKGSIDLDGSQLDVDTGALGQVDVDADEG